MSKKSTPPENKQKKAKMYRFKVSLVGHHYQPIKNLHRIIDIDANATFDVLHQVIFEAFDRFDEHLYKFYLTRTETKDISKLFDCQDMVIMPNDFQADEGDYHLVNTFTLGDADLQEKEFMYYWFDFGDDWIHRIRVEKIFYINDDSSDDEDGYYYGIIKKVGDSPAQYHEDSVWNPDNEAGQEQQMAMALLALSDPATASDVTLMHLESVGVLDTMIELGIIEKPKSNLSNFEKNIQRAKLTPEGEMKAETLMTMLEQMGDNLR